MKTTIDPRVLPDIQIKEVGFMIDARGAHIPIDLVKPVDKKRDKLVKAIATHAKQVSSLLSEVKKLWNAEIDNYVENVAKSYDVKLGGKKGNITLVSFDGAFKIQIAVAERIVFDERLQIAKALIDKCIKGWTKDSRSEILVLINSAFEVDKQGKINTEKILSLRRLKITSEDWKKSMSIIGDSIQVASSKSYIRIYERDGEESYRQIPLDFAAL